MKLQIPHGPHRVDDVAGALVVLVRADCDAAPAGAERHGVAAEVEQRLAVDPVAHLRPHLGANGPAEVNKLFVAELCWQLFWQIAGG